MLTDVRGRETNEKHFPEMRGDMMVGIVEVDILQLINSARLAGQGASGIQLSPSPQCWSYQQTLPHWLIHGS